MSLAFLPHQRAKCYNGYYVNGFKFHPLEHGESRATMNSGVWVLGSASGNDDMDYYGMLEEVLELDYFGDTVVLFKCQWYDTSSRTGIREHRGFNLVEINRKTKLKSDDVFVLAKQAQQVYYTEFPKKPQYGDRGDWVAVCKIKARSRTVVNLTNDNEDEELRADSPFQESVSSTPIEHDLIVDLEDTNILLNRNVDAEEVDPSELHYTDVNENEEEEEDEEEEYEEAFGDLFSDEEPENEAEDGDGEYSSGDDDGNELEHDDI